MKYKGHLLIICLWVLCGIMNWGLTLGYFDHRFPQMRNTPIAIATFIGGPLATPAVLIEGYPYHWRFVPPTREQIWQRYHERWPDLPRKEFDEEVNR